MSERLPPVAILCGGLATRLRPLTDRCPKCLVDVNGVPFLVHQLRLLRSRGFDSVVLCVGHLGERVCEEIARHDWGALEIRFSHDGPVLLGTAGAARNALPLLGEEFFLLYGDSYLPFDYGAMLRAFRAGSQAALMAVFRNEDRWKKSNVRFEGGALVGYSKSAPTASMRHVDYGVGLFRSAAFEAVPAGVASDLSDLYRGLLARGLLAGHVVCDPLFEIGSFEGLEELRRALAEARVA